MKAGKSLSDIIKDRILQSGKISFAEYMESALYYPKLGYYSSERIKIGKSGDYFTSTSVHSVFGELICKQIEEMWRISGSGSFVIVEMGAGDGTLCCDILNAAKNSYPSFFNVLQYLIIEESAYLRKVQQGRLKELFSGEDKVRWTDTADPVFSSGITGCFLSNELVDAFPVHVVEKIDGALKEIYVGVKDDSLSEIIDKISSPEIEKYFETLGIALEEGQRAEVNLKAVEWMKWIAGSLNKGFVITIDYGYPAEGLYAPDRRKGTLVCYHKHRMVEDPFINIGEQDMTSHVDFTTLMMTGEGCGLRTAGITDQTRFLFGLGIGKCIEEISEKASTEEEALKARLLIKNLIMPGRMGNVFKVLVQYKGFDSQPELSGLKKDPYKMT